MPEDTQLQIVEDIYDSALDSGRWRGLLARIADHCGAENASLVALNAQLPFASVIAPRADETMVMEFGQRWAQYDPSAGYAASQPAGVLMTMNEIGREAFVASDYHNEYWKKLGFGVERLSVNLLADGRGFVNIGLQTYASRDEFSEDSTRRYMALVPHLRRSVDIAGKLSQLAVNEAVADNGLSSAYASIVAVDRRGFVVFADDGAIALFEAGLAMRAVNGRIRLIDDTAQKALDAAIETAAGNPAMRPVPGIVAARHDAELPPLAIDVLPFRSQPSPIIPVGPGGPAPAAILLIHDPLLARKARAERLQERFGLTQTEAVLAIEMSRGDGREAAAKRCGISINTARTHLMRVFDKVGVTRQAELVRVLLDS